MAVSEKTIMPFGKHRGKALANVPANYLLFLFEKGKLYGDVCAYVRENKEQLEKEEHDSRSWAQCDASEFDLY